jgi:hypothetical protein
VASKASGVWWSVGASRRVGQEGSRKRDCYFSPGIIVWRKHVPLCALNICVSVCVYLYLSLSDFLSSAHALFLTFSPRLCTSNTHTQIQTNTHTQKHKHAHMHTRVTHPIEVMARTVAVEFALSICLHIAASQCMQTCYIH